MDINSYALNLSFNLTSNADAVLGKVQDILATIQVQLEQTAKAAKTAFNFGDASGTASAINIGLNNINANMLNMVGSAGVFGVDMHDINDIAVTLNRQFKESEEHLSAMERTTKTLKSGFGLVAKTTVGLIGSLLMVSDAIREISQEQEHFSTLSGTLYGSQNDMIKQMSRLTLEYGVYGKEASEAFTNVIDNIRITDSMLQELAGSQEEFNKATQDSEYRLKLARTGLSKYSELAGKFSRVTGASTETVVKWQSAISSIGVNFKDTEKVMNSMVGAMKAAGLTSNDITKLLNKQTESATELNYTYGEDGVRAIMDYQVNLASLFKKNNIDDGGMVEAISEVYADVKKSTMLAAIGQKAAQEKYGLTLTDSVEDQRKAATYGLEALVDEANRLKKQGKTASQVGLEVWSKIGGVSQKQLAALSLLHEKGININEDAVARIIAFNKKQAPTLDEAYEQSRNTMTSAWEKFFQTIMEGWKLIVIQVSPYITKFLAQIQPIADAFGKAGTWLDAFNTQAMNMEWPQYFKALFAELGAEIAKLGGEGNTWFPWIGQLVTDMGDTMSWVLEQAPIWWNNLTTTIGSWYDSTKPWIEWFFSAISSGFESAKWWVTFFSTMWDQYWPGIQQGFAWVKDAAVGTFEYLGEAFSGAIFGWKAFGAAASDSFKYVIDACVGLIKTLDPVGTLFTSIWGSADSMFGGLGDVLTGFWNTIKSVWNAITGGTASVVQNAVEAANLEAKRAQLAANRKIAASVTAIAAANKEGAAAAEKVNGGSNIKIDRDRLHTAAAEGQKALNAKMLANNPYQNAMDAADPAKMAKASKRVTVDYMKFATAQQKMSLAEFMRSSNNVWSHYDPSTGKALKIDEKAYTDALSKARAEVSADSKAESLKPNVESITQDDKLARKRTDTESAKLLADNVEKTKEVVTALKDNNPKEVLTGIATTLVDIKNLQNTSRNTIGTTGVTGW